MSYILYRLIIGGSNKDSIDAETKKSMPFKAPALGCSILTEARALLRT